MKAQARIGLVYTSFAPIQILVLLAALLGLSTANAAPRTPQPPWPQSTLKIFGFDAAYWRGPWSNVAVNEDPATLVDSWSGYSLLRDGFYSTPVLIPVGDAKTTRNVAVPYGAIRFWVAPNWSTADEKTGGKGPGRFARFLEMVNVNDTTAQVQWSLYVNEAGDTIYLSHPSKEGMIDVLKAPVTFSAGDWSMVTIAYSTTNTVLWLNNEPIAAGNGLPLLSPASPADLALVIGSDVYCSADSMAGAQFEEITTFERWSSKSDWQDFYFQAYKRHSLLGPISDEEAAAMAQRRAERKAKMEEEGDSGGVAMMRFASSGPSSVCVTNGPVYMTNVVSYYTTNAGWTVGFDIVGGTNGVPYDIFSATNLLGNHITNTVWQWEDVGYTCHSYIFTNQPEQMKYFILGTTNDTDADLLTDAYELLVSKTLFNDADTDNDGMPDGWEVHNGLNPLDPADASDDPDGDWLTNFQEYNGGTNSSNPHDLMVVAWGDNSDGQCNVPENLRDVVAVAGGFDFSLALRKDGTVVPWGANTYGQTNISAGLTNATMLSARWWDGAALKSDGTMKRWGASSWPVPTWATNLSRIAVGYDYVLGLQSNGAVVAWGQPSYRTNLIPSLTNIIEIAASTDHKVALRNNGSVVAWGLSYSNAGWNLTNVPASATNVTSISAGEYHTLALKADGTVVAWGAGTVINPSGGFLGADLGQSIVPAGLSNVVAVAAAGYHSLALRVDGSVVGWGNIPSPGFLQSNVVAIASAQDHNLAIRSGRQLPVIVEGPVSKVALPGSNVTFTSLALGLAGVKYQWQFSSTNITGQTNAALTLNNVSTNNEGGYTVVFSTGAGSITSSVATLTVVRPPQIVFVNPGLSNFVWVTSNTNLSVVATASGTNVYPLRYQWFRDALTLTNLTSATLPIYVFAFTAPTDIDGAYSVRVTNAVGSTNVGTWPVRALFPGMVGGWGTNSDGQIDRPADLTNTISLSAGKYHSVAAREDGSVSYWGYTWASLPTDLTNIVSVSAGYAHTLVLRNDGSVTTWGQAGTYANTVPANNFGMKSIAAGTYHNLAVLTNGNILAWGANFPGFWNLTDVPANVTNVTAVAAGTYHSLALKADGTVAGWGYNGSGQTNVPSGLTNAVAIAAGERFSVALRANGTIVAWGDNGLGQTNVPAGLSNVMAIAAGWAHGVALKNDGSVVCWGDNIGGQTNTVSNLPPVKLIAAGGNHTLISLFSPLLQYPVDVTKDLLLIYNTNSINSIVVKDYYLAHRPMVSEANVLGIGCPTNEIISTADFTNQIRAAYWNWLNQNPTKHPQYVILFPDIPTRIWGDTSDTATISNSVAFELHSQTPGITPFITSINMGLCWGGGNCDALTNDCIAYINKLAAFGSNYSPGQLFISASSGGYAGTNFVLENLRHGAGWPFPEPNFSGYGGIISAVTNVIYNSGVSEVGAIYNDGIEAYGQPALSHITNAVDVAGYMCWGGHSSLGNEYPVNGQVKWSGTSGWWVIETIESFNGWRATGQGNFTQWFSPYAFGGTNYSNTPVGAVTHTDEPLLVGINDPQVFFGMWLENKSFAHCAWVSRRTPRFQAVGDPFVRR